MAKSSSPSSGIRVRRRTRADQHLRRGQCRTRRPILEPGERAWRDGCFRNRALMLNPSGAPECRSTSAPSIASTIGVVWYAAPFAVSTTTLTPDNEKSFGTVEAAKTAYSSCRFLDATNTANRSAGRELVGPGMIVFRLDGSFEFDRLSL